MTRLLNIYFFGSIFGAESNRPLVKELLGHVKTKGHVLSEHLFDDDYRTKETLDAKGIRIRDLTWIRQSDVLVGDVTAPSLGVGYELRDAEILAKPILALYNTAREGKLSAMIEGAAPGITVVRYSDLIGAKNHIDEFFEYLKLTGFR
ncbi:nucleoside 2-deoxyribosyltransferase [Candidatus Pacearchaeota archaeon]|nr:nucleoside 2-deoxyribosyltransferase [Candidatus Pacearchaeota archaeon]